MLWMKYLLPFVVLLDVCTAQTPSLYYSFDSIVGPDYGRYFFSNTGSLNTPASSWDAKSEGADQTILSSDSQVGSSVEFTRYYYSNKINVNQRTFGYDFTQFGFPLTVSIFFKVASDYNGGYGLFSYADDTFKIFGDDMCIYARVSTNLYAQGYTEVTTNYCWQNSPKGKWYNVMAIVKNVNNFAVISLYLDGILQDSGTGNFQYDPYYKNSMNFGQVCGVGYCSYFKGFLDEIKIFSNMELTPSQIATVTHKKCEEGYYSSTICTACPEGTWTIGGPGITIDDCKRCSVGYTGPDSTLGVATCTGCVAGKYKTTTGSVACTDCDVGTYSETVHASTSSTCLTCPANSNSPASSSGIVTCTCNAGFTGPDGGVCSSCVAGKYKTTSGSIECTNCGVNTYSQVLGASASYSCTACDIGKNSPVGSTSSTACESVCDVGTTGPPGACTGCVAGKYKTTTGSVACTDCGIATYSGTAGASTSSTCLGCPSNSNAPSSSSASAACACNVGYTGANGGTCTACVAGKYKDVSGSVVCSDCSAGTYSLTIAASVSSNCVGCPTSSNSAAASTSCTCNVGYSGPDAGACSACAAGKYKAITGSAACTDCGLATYSGTAGASASSTCVACPANTNAPSSSSAGAACACNIGYTGANGGTCTACVAGKYKTVSGSAVCSDCSAGTYLLTTGATAAGACIGCPMNSNSAASSSSSAACTCNAGYTGPDGGSCSACLAGSFKTQTGSAACELCPNNTFSADTGRSSACAACQANAVSASGSVSQSYCYCKSGYAHTAGMSTCRICDPGTYNSQLGRTACSNCSVGMYSVNYGAIGSETCLMCPVGQWSPEGSPNCNLCPANSRAGVGSGYLRSCTCDKGYTGADGSTCVACPAATYKDATGPGTCSTCPALTSSSGAATSLSECWCVTGYIRVAGACVAMVPRAVAVTGSLSGVPANSSAAYVQNATEALRASIALRLNISIDLVLMDRALNSTEVRVSIFGRSETELDAIEGQVRIVGIAGLNNTQTTVLQGQMVAGQFVQCPANYRVYERDQNLARSCGASGNEFCQASSKTYSTLDGIVFGAQLANDGITSDGIADTLQDNPDHLRYISARTLGQMEWWQVDLSRQRDIRSVTIYAFLIDAARLRNFDLQLSNDGITFVNCATQQNAEQQYAVWEPPFVSTHSCVGSARYVRISMYAPNDEPLVLLEVQVYGETLAGTCKCAPGYRLLPDMSTCTACAAGKYSNAIASTACADCPANTFSTGASTTCSDCPTNSVSAPQSSTLLACSCIAGYFFFFCS